MKEKLTGKRRLFVAEYLKDFNATQAAIRAGYSSKTADANAHRMMENDGIKAAIDAEQREREAEAKITAEFIDAALLEVAERCMERAPVMEFYREARAMVQKTVKMPCDCGDPSCKGTLTLGIWEFDSNGAIRALELMAKRVRNYLAPSRSEFTSRDGQPLVPEHKNPTEHLTEAKVDLLLKFLVDHKKR